MSRRVLITGASRGLGLELARQYADAGWQVEATCRRPERAEALQRLAADGAPVRTHALDVRSAEQIDALASTLADTSLDLLFHNAGIYGRKRLPIEAVDADEWLDVLATNALAPFFLTRALLPPLERGREKKIAVLGSKVGSIADNTSGGNYGYRTSKAALNQVVRNLAIDLADRGIRVVALHPGWVKTDMGGPNALIEPEESVRGMRRVVERLTEGQSGGFFAYDGSRVPW